MNDILVMQELIRENETLKNKIARIEDIKLQINIAESTNAVALYKKDLKSFNDYKTDLRKNIESSSAYKDVAKKLARNGKHKVMITDNFSITPYIKEDLDKETIIKHYEDINLNLPIIEKIISEFKI